MRLLANTKPLRRLYRVSLGSAFFISLPILILVGWMIGDSYLEYRRFAQIGPRGQTPAFNSSIMHMYLRTALQRAYIRATAPEMPTDGSLPTVEMSIDKENLAALNSNLPRSGKSQFYRAYLKFNGKSYTVKARYMGDNYWHWLYPQKSWRIKTKKSKLIAEARKINIKNPRTIITFNECVAQDLARDIGLIAPRVQPVRLIVNNIYTGVHLFWDVIDESVIRRFGKMPGSVYSGDGARGDPNTGVSLLWKDEKWWTKSASRSADQKEFREDIKVFLDAVNNPDLTSFYDFVNRHVDKEVYASFLSLDNLTACMHHDFHHNNKFYFDPITGKVLPISWDIDLWHLESPAFDATGNPLLNKWKSIPEFDLLRKRRLYELLNSDVFSADGVLKRIDAYDKKIRPSLEADVYRDAKYEAFSILKLPKPPCVPFSMNTYDKQIRHFKDQVRRRIAMLRGYLSKSDMTCSLTDSAEDEDVRIMCLVAHGNVGRQVTGVKLRGNAKSVTVFKDINRNRTVDDSDIVVGQADLSEGECLVPFQEQVLPGYKKVPLDARFNPKTFSRFGLEVSPLAYNYIIKAHGGTIKFAEIESCNIVTGEPEETIYGPTSGESLGETISLHPWDLPLKPEKATMTLGPGVVNVSQTAIYPEHISLTILPGTTIRLAEGVSIFSYGKVTAVGNADNPIRFIADDPEKPWGVFVLQGKGSSGSIFEYCSWEDGSEATRELIYYSGMVSVHDVDNVTIRNCTIGRNHLGDDALHLAYCNNLIVEGCLFMGARADALDIDISEGKLTGNRFSHCGNDALDLMTSNVKVTACVFDTAGDKGISVGEKSTLAVGGCVFKRCHIGVEIKDRSFVSFGENVIRGSSIAVNLYKKNWRYDGGGHIEGDTVYAIDCGEAVKMDKYSGVKIKGVETSAPELDIWRDAVSKAGALAPTSHI